MKKIGIFLFLLILTVFLGAQSVRDLEAYKLMRENQQAYQAAYEKGDYDAALEYAEQVKTYAEEVKTYLDNLEAEPEPEPEPEPVVETPPEPEPEVEPEPIRLDKEYTVVTGDTFWDIAGKEEFYNDPWKWPEIYKSNKNVLKEPDNPDLINPGMVFNFTIILEESND